MRIEIPTLGGAKIKGTHWHKKRAKTLLVICYGYKASADHPAIQIIANDLHKKNYDVLAFTFSADHVDIAGQTEDIKAIVKYFAPRYNSIILLASSLGALSATIAATGTQEVRGLVTLNGFFGLSYLGRLPRRIYWFFRLAAVFNPKYRRIWAFYKSKYKPQNIGVPVLVIHAKNDTEVLVAQSEHFYACLVGPKEFKTILLADHNVSQPSDAHTIARIIADWLEQRAF